WPEEPPVVQAYLSYMTARPDSMVASIRTVATARGAVLVHCAAGKDRTGVVDAIMARLVSSPTYRSELEGHDPRTHAPVPGTIERVLELLDERFGGSAAWLSAHGLTNAELERLRRKITSVNQSRSSD